MVVVDTKLVVLTVTSYSRARVERVARSQMMVRPISAVGITSRFCLSNCLSHASRGVNNESLGTIGLFDSNRRLCITGFTNGYVSIFSTRALRLGHDVDGTSHALTESMCIRNSRLFITTNSDHRIRVFRGGANGCLDHLNANG